MKIVKSDNDAYMVMNDSGKLRSSDKKNMWEIREWTEMNKQTIYRSNWSWSIS